MVCELPPKKCRTTPVGAPETAPLWFGSCSSGRKMKILLLYSKRLIWGLNNSDEHWPWSQVLTQYPLADLFRSGVRAVPPQETSVATTGLTMRVLTEYEHLLCWLNACAARPMGTILNGENQWTISYSAVTSWPCPWCCPVGLHTFAGHEEEVRNGSISPCLTRKAPDTEALPS